MKDRNIVGRTELAELLNVDLIALDLVGRGSDRCAKSFPLPHKVPTDEFHTKGGLD